MKRNIAGPLCFLLMLGSVPLIAQDAQPVNVPTIRLPPVVRSVRANHTGPGIITAQQPTFPAEISLSNHSESDWMEFTQAISRTQAEIVTAKLGWAYALPSGLEFHEGELVTPPGGVATGQAFGMPAQGVKPRADAKNLVAFVEQVTFADGTVSNADHAQITNFYNKCCTGANAGKIVLPPEPEPKDRKGIPGGAAGTGPVTTANLKPIKFDVVSFRRVQQPGRGREFPADGDFLAYHGSPIDALLAFAYGGIVPGYFAISGEPDWVKTDMYEFTAKVAPEDVKTWKAMTLTDKRFMMQGTLADALKLKVHNDTELHPVYDLVVAKGGPKLMDYQPGDTVTPPYGDARAITGKVLSWFDPFHLTCQDITMAELVNSLSGPNRAGRVVIDKTGLTGVYDFTVPIPYRPMPEQIQQMVEESGVPSFFEGLKELGLAAVPDKGTVNGIVVDHIEKPETNEQ